LRRTTLDDFDLSQAYTLDMLEAISIPERDFRLLPVDTLLRDLPAVTLEAPAAAFLRQGRSVADVGGAGMEGQKIRLYDERKNFLGLGEMTLEGEIAPKKIVGNVQKL
jgi:tRNA pseudouridine55 synthase